MTSTAGDEADHNERQRLYFERGGSHRTLQPTGSRYLHRHVDAMMDFAEIRPGDRVLEVGAGLGRNTLILADRGVAVEACDLSAALLEDLQRRAQPRTIPVHAFDIVDAPVELRDRYDAVVGFFVLHHVHDVEECMSVAARLVKPGGRVAFVEPNPWNPLYYAQIFFSAQMSWSEERGLLRIRREYMRAAMGAAGLVDLSDRCFGFFPPFVTNTGPGERLEAAIERVSVGRSVRPFQLFGGQRAAGPS